MNIIFRVDSSSKIGLGHIMRCLALAKQYKKDNIIFATRNLSGNVNNKIHQQNYQIHNLISNKSQELAQVIKKLNMDMVVFDHYDIDYSFEKIIKEDTGIKILSFDDTYEKHYCDILLNHNIYAKYDHYKNLVPDFCEIRCGAKYTLIRDEFRQIKPKKRTINRNNPTVFVAMGGSDTTNISLSVLKILTKFDNITINLATTSANKNLAQLQKFSKAHYNINININNENIANIMDNSDFAIITPSVIVYEVMYLNLPFIAIKTADNQQYIYQYLKDKNYLVINDFDAVLFQNKVIKILK